MWLITNMKKLTDVRISDCLSKKKMSQLNLLGKAGLCPILPSCFHLLISFQIGPMKSEKSPNQLIETQLPD